MILSIILTVALVVTASLFMFYRAGSKAYVVAGIFFALCSLAAADQMRRNHDHAMPGWMQLAVVVLLIVTVAIWAVSIAGNAVMESQGHRDSSEESASRQEG